MPSHKLTTDIERFLSKVAPLNENGCRLWMGSLVTGSGYGQIGVGSRASGTFKMRRAHSFALETALGRPLFPGMVSLHTCDIRTCVCTDDVGFYEINGILRHRRGHLWEGTVEENVADRVNKNRSAMGTRNSGQKRLSKLTADEVLCIRARHTAGKNYYQLADEFGVTFENIHYIVKRKTWRHI